MKHLIYKTEQVEVEVMKGYFALHNGYLAIYDDYCVSIVDIKDYYVIKKTNYADSPKIDQEDSCNEITEYVFNQKLAEVLFRIAGVEIVHEQNPILCRY